MRHPMTDSYGRERADLLALGRSLTEADGATMTQACPAWSIKDVYAHLAGISTDILAGNTEKAATPEWADGHVADRQAESLVSVLDEWTESGAGVSDVMEVAGTAFPFQLFVDQWTHNWDIRAAVGERAAATPDMAVYEHFLDDFVLSMEGDVPDALPQLELVTGGRSIPLGTGPSVGQLPIGLFEYARISMGRRSQSQLDALPWPEALTDRSPYIDLLVRWSVNEVDVVDPALQT